MIHRKTSGCIHDPNRRRQGTGMANQQARHNFNDDDNGDGNGDEDKDEDEDEDEDGIVICLIESL